MSPIITFNKSNTVYEPRNKFILQISLKTWTQMRKYSFPNAEGIYIHTLLCMLKKARELFLYTKLKTPQGALNVHFLLINSKWMQILCTVETHFVEYNTKRTWIEMCIERIWLKWKNRMKLDPAMIKTITMVEWVDKYLIFSQIYLIHQNSKKYMIE